MFKYVSPSWGNPTPGGTPPPILKYWISAATKEARAKDKNREPL